MSQPPYRLLIVDDDHIALQALSRFFSTTDDFLVVATVPNGQDALALLQHEPVDVVLADIHMPSMNGLALLKEIKGLAYPPVFVAITALDNDKTVMKVLANGGSGYILKSQTPESVIQSVRDAATGGLVVSPNAVHHFIEKIPGTQPAHSRPSPLIDTLTSTSSPMSQADKDVLKLLCQGKNNMEIAAAMHYSESATKKRVSKLIHQFDARSRLDLVVTMLGPSQK